MNRILFILILAAVSVSCKSKHLLASTGANETISAQKIIDNQEVTFQLCQNYTCQLHQLTDFDSFLAIV